MVRERAERGADPTPAPPAAGLNIAEIRQLISLMNSSDIEEIGIEQESQGLKLVLRKQVPPAQSIEVDGEAYDPGDDADEPPREKGVDVGAHMVGIFRANMKPGGKPMVARGDVVREGQVIAAIEALNVLNEIEAPSAGRVRDILVKDGQPIEYGQLLMVIEP